MKWIVAIAVRRIAWLVCTQMGNKADNFLFRRCSFLWQPYSDDLKIAVQNYYCGKKGKKKSYYWPPLAAI